MKNIGSYGYSKTFSITNNHDINRIPVCNLTVIRKDNKSNFHIVNYLFNEAIELYPT